MRHTRMTQPAQSPHGRSARAVADCRRLSSGHRVTVSPCRRVSRSAFTLAEMVVAVTIMVIVTAVVASLFVQVRKMVGLTQWTSETRTQLRTTVNTLAEDLRNIDDSMYLVLLNRDYFWEKQGTDYVGPPLYHDDAQNPNIAVHEKAFWADRLAFVARGPFNEMNFDPSTGGKPGTATSARIYYGQSLWTHELGDAIWVKDFYPAMLAQVQPQQWAQWSADAQKRPAVNWILSRQATLSMQDPTLNDTSRLLHDKEFCYLKDALGLYTLTDMSQWVNSNVTNTTFDWFSLVWPPQVYRDKDDAGNNYDPGTSQSPGGIGRNYAPVLAPYRVLLPHAARVRFQIRLSDGTIVPQTDDTSVSPYLRGRLVTTQTGDSTAGANTYIGLGRTASTIDASLPSMNGKNLDPADIGRGGGSVHAIPTLQKAYIWTPNTTNVTSPNPVHPVGLRVRIEVYNPDKQVTPDPITIDEWLPIRWNSQPTPAP